MRPLSRTNASKILIVILCSSEPIPPFSLRAYLEECAHSNQYSCHIHCLLDELAIARLLRSGLCALILAGRE